MKNYALELYRQMFVSVKRGNSKGVFSHAKPIFLITIIDSIPNALKKNNLLWGNKVFDALYIKNWTELSSQKITPIWKPFFYLSSEPFYELRWLEKPPDSSLNFPSGKVLKDFLNYAKLDDELWKLLQDESNRSYLRECLIKYYFTSENK